MLADGKLVGPQDVTAQTEQCLSNLFTLVAAKRLQPRRHSSTLGYEDQLVEIDAQVEHSDSKGK